MAVREIGDGRPAARARLAARHAERLYPGPLGRLVARELTDYAESAPPAGGGLAASVVGEILDRTPPAAALVPSSELQRPARRAS